MGPNVDQTSTPDADSGPPRIKFLGPIMFEAGQERELRYEITEIDAPFHVLGIAVPGDPKMSAFIVHDIRRNGASFAGNGSPIPALVFHEEGIGLNLGIDTLRYGDSITISLSNTSSSPALFVGVLYGMTESNVSSNVAGSGEFTAAFGPSPIASGATAIYEVELKMDLMPTMLLVPASAGKNFEIVAFDVAGKRQLERPFEASRIDEHQHQRNANLRLEAAIAFRDVGRRGDKIRLGVRNKTATQEVFSAVLFGKKGVATLGQW